MNTKYEEDMYESEVQFDIENASNDALEMK